MTSNKELRDLIRKAEDAGAQIMVSYDPEAAVQEGRAIINAVGVLKTEMPPFNDIGPGWISSISAAEILGTALSKVAPPMSSNDGGPAFPLGANSPWRGLSMRDYFAAKAMAGFCADGAMADECSRRGIPPTEARYVYAKNAYALADAMLAERSKP